MEYERTEQIINFMLSFVHVEKHNIKLQLAPSTYKYNALKRYLNKLV